MLGLGFGLTYHVALVFGVVNGEVWGVTVLQLGSGLTRRSYLFWRYLQLFVNTVSLVRDVWIGSLP